MSSTAPVRVLLVDDDRQEFVLTQGLLSIAVQDRYALEWVGSYEAAMQSVDKGEHDLYLVDYRLQAARTGLDLLKEAKARGCQKPFILLTGLWDTNVDREAMRSGAADYLVKGQFGPDVLERSLRYALERARVMSALRESEEKYRTLVEGTNALVFDAGLDGRITYVNEAASRLLGLPPERVKGRSYLRFLHPSERREVARAVREQMLAGSTTVSIETRCAGAGGIERWVSVSLNVARPAGRALRVTGVAVDVTERRRLQSMFLQAEKLSAMGLLAAGLAHELNNPLMLILGSADTALEAAPDDPALAEHMRTILRAGERCRALVARLLDFSRKEDSPPREFDLGDCVASALALAEPQARYRSIRVVRELHPAPLRLRGHQNQLEQVILNLANNALDAMPKGGTLTLRTRASSAAGRPAAEIQVGDTGVGIPPELRERIFEPFFTTKAPGKGTGLGLSLAHEIVAKHGGRIAFSANEGSGTTFSIVVPLAAAAPAPAELRS